MHHEVGGHDEASIGGGDHGGIVAGAEKRGISRPEPRQDARQCGVFAELADGSGLGRLVRALVHALHASVRRMPACAATRPEPPAPRRRQQLGRQARCDSASVSTTVRSSGRAAE